MSAPRRAAVAAGAIVLAALGVLLVWRAVDRGGDGADAPRRGPVAAVVTDLGPAEHPFSGATAGTIRVGRTRLRVVVADDSSEQVRGLRGRRDAAPYDGMLFVFARETTTPFTMSGVPGPLDIAFYGSDGAVVDRLRMEPCAGGDASCPVYEAGGAFRYALETAPGALPAGRLRVASS